MTQTQLQRAQAALLGARLAAGDREALHLVRSTCATSTWPEALAILGVARSTLRGWLATWPALGSGPVDGRTVRYARARDANCHLEPDSDAGNVAE